MRVHSHNMKPYITLVSLEIELQQSDSTAVGKPKILKKEIM